MMLCLIKMKMKPICIYHYLWLNPFCSHKFQYNCYLMCVRVWECVYVDKVVKNFSTTIYTKLHHCIPFTFVMFASRTTALRTSTSMIKYRMRFVKGFLKGFYHNTQYSCLNTILLSSSPFHFFLSIKNYQFF